MKFLVSGILSFVPEMYRTQYGDIDLLSKVEIHSKFRNESLNRIILSAATLSKR